MTTVSSSGTVTSVGSGTGLDINKIVGAYVDAEITPASKLILSEQAEITAKISAYGLVNSTLSDFQSSYKALGYSSTFAAATATSSNSGALDATLGVGAEAGEWNFQVTQRAQAQTLVSSKENGFSEVTDPVGEGVLQLSIGSYDATGNFIIDASKPVESITISNSIDEKTGRSNNSLSGLRETINNGDYSVTASIMNDGDNYRLILTSKDTGEQNAVQIIAKDSGGVAITGGTGLDRFNYAGPSDPQPMSRTIVAQDAKLSMNGIDIVSDQNNVSNVIQGVTLNLNGTGDNISLKISKDTTKVEDNINAFIENYNTTLSKINELTAYSPNDKSAGVLNGDSTMRSIKDMMRGVLNTIVDNTSGNIHSFADLGILSNKNDGSLSLDKEVFAKALKNDMQGVADFFTLSGAATDPLIDFAGKTSVTKTGTYPIEVTQLATQGNLSGSDISANFPLTIDDSNDNFTIRVDGFSSAGADPANPYIIALTQGSYASLDDLATELQSKINSAPHLVDNNIGVTVANDNGKLSITSSSYGSSSMLAFNDVDAGFLASFGFDAPIATNGVDVQGTIDGKAAVGNGQSLLSDSGDSTGIKVLIKGGNVGPRGNVVYAEPLTSRMTKMLAGIIDSNVSNSDADVATSQGMMDSKFDMFNKRLTELDTKTEDLAARKDTLQTRLYAQYNAMDIAVSNMKNTMSYLTATLDSLPGYSNKKK